MDQDREDYADRELTSRHCRPRPWTALQIILLLVTIAIGVPVVGFIVLMGLIALSWEGR